MNSTQSQTTVNTTLVNSQNQTNAFSMHAFTSTIVSFNSGLKKCLITIDRALEIR